MTPQKVISIWLRISNFVFCSAFSYLGVFLTIMVWKDITVDRRAIWLVGEQVVSVVVATVLLKNWFRKYICNHIMMFFICSFIFHCSTIWIMFIDPYYKVLLSILDFGIFVGFMRVHSMEVREIIFTKRKQRIRFNIDLERCEAGGFIVGAFLATQFYLESLTTYIVLDLSFMVIDLIQGILYYLFLDKFMKANNIEYSGGDLDDGAEIDGK